MHQFLLHKMHVWFILSRAGSLTFRVISSWSLRIRVINGLLVLSCHPCTLCPSASKGIFKLCCWFYLTPSKNTLEMFNIWPPVWTGEDLDIESKNSNTLDCNYLSDSRFPKIQVHCEYSVSSGDSAYTVCE